MKKEKLEEALQIFLNEIGLDLTDPNLKDTPKRISRMFAEEFLLNVNQEPSKGMMKVFPNEKKYDEVILWDNIPFVSLCSHHFLPFPGLAWLLYIPNLTLAGASKPARVLDYFSRRPQLQENLGMEVVDFFEKEVSPIGVMLVMRAVHGCMSCRGVRTGGGAGMITSITRGAFRENPATREEGLHLIQLSVALKGLMG